jgi:hypothetical protein
MPLKVIGAGFARTGTLSLKNALEHLGFYKCYHNQELRITKPYHIDTWMDAAEGRSVDWEVLFEGYQATVDFPASLFYKELFRQYPNAKVILTKRNPERWYASMMDTIYSHKLPGSTLMTDNQPEFMASAPKSSFIKKFLYMQEKLIWSGLFENRFEDKEYAIQVYQEHIDQVKEIVPSNQLLVFHIKEGWDPLCKFLEVPVPLGVPVPHVNRRDEWGGRDRQSQAT